MFLGAGIGSGARRGGALIGSRLASVDGRSAHAMKFERRVHKDGLSAECIDASTGHTWSVGTIGFFEARFEPSHTLPGPSLALSDNCLNRVYMLVSNGRKWSNDPLSRRAILDMAATDLVLTPTQAQWFVKRIGRRFDELVVVSLVLPVAARCKMTSTELVQCTQPGHVLEPCNDLFEFVCRNLDGTATQLKLLIGMIGVERYRFNVHNPTGSWRLDLRREDHREILTLLVDVSETEMRQWRDEKKQNEDALNSPSLYMDCFRNARLDSAPVELNHEFLSPLPRTVSTMRA